MGHARAPLKLCPTPGCTNYQMRGRKSCGPCTTAKIEDSPHQRRGECRKVGCHELSVPGRGHVYCEKHVKTPPPEAETEDVSVHDDTESRQAAMRFMLGKDSW